MKNRKTNLISILLLQAILFVAGPAISGTISTSAHDDLFLENVYEDYTLESVSNAVVTHQSSDFASMETNQAMNDEDIFLESVFEDYTISR